jgi:monofunctional biosynthetic peptidoglycan transglycosylase
LGEKSIRARSVSSAESPAERARPRQLVETKLREWKQRILIWGGRPLQIVLAAIAFPYRLFKIFCFLLGLAVLAAGAMSYAYVSDFLRSLPDMDHMTMKDLQTIAHKRVDEHLTNKKAYYHWTELADINRGYLYSIVTSEDATFFEHDGFNYDAIMDSLAENIRERKPAFGASTISQQVVKNVFLGNEKTLVRKFKEFLITRALEHQFTKNQILEVYLNIAEFGPDIFGVDAASKHYFNKSPAEINAAEGAFLALMLPSPRRNYYSIWQNRNLTKLKRRRLERVLRDMLYEEYITESQYHQFVHYHYFPGKSARMPARAHP